MRFYSFLALLLFYCYASAQSPINIPFDDARWNKQGNHELVDYRGQTALKIDDGKAGLPDVKFLNGLIEFDIAFDEGRGFKGVRFRCQDDNNSEEYYLRPHQSGNPDAMQYTPVFNGFAGWQLYHGENHSNTHRFRFDEWMHVRLAIFGDQMEIFIDNMSVPILYVFDLKHDALPGFVEVYSSNTVYFANFQYTPLNSYNFVSSTKTPPAIEPGTVASWEVSNAFEAAALGQGFTLPKALPQSLKWQQLSSEFTGLANVASIAKATQTERTTLAKFSLSSEAAQTKWLELGYSDDAQVYVNGQLIYRGQRRFRSRDYRYLGTIGYFDAVALPLKAGENEVIIALSENFGGWGVKARFPDMNGITLKK